MPARIDCVRQRGSDADGPQPQRVGDHRDRAQRHRRGGDDRAQEDAENAGRARRPPPARRARCRRRRRTGSGGCCASSRRSGRGRARSPRRSPLTSVTPALSIATSVPVPMAMPTSAAASAGASLTPSPAIATTRPCSRSRLHDRALLLRQHLGLDLVDAEPPATASAVVRLSPVSMTMRTPAVAQRRERLGRRGLDRVGDRDQPGHRAVRPRRTSPLPPRAAARRPAPQRPRCRPRAPP